MGLVLHPYPSTVLRHVRFNTPPRVESRSPLPAFKNFGRGVF
jgi:hypothetical protein